MLLRLGNKKDFDVVSRLSRREKEGEEAGIYKR